MSNGYTLVLVDVQPDAPWGYLVTNQLLDGCEREVVTAIEFEYPVVATDVAYWSINDDWYGPTDKRLMQHLKGYEFYSQCPKMATSDGAYNVLGVCQHDNFGTDHFVVVGVRGNGCVIAMVEGLRREIPGCRITVVQDACNEDPELTDWSAFEQIEGVELVTRHAR